MYLLAASRRWWARRRTRRAASTLVFTRIFSSAETEVKNNCSNNYYPKIVVVTKTKHFKITSLYTMRGLLLCYKKMLVESFMYPGYNNWALQKRILFPPDFLYPGHKTFIRKVLNEMLF